MMICQKPRYWIIICALASISLVPVQAADKTNKIDSSAIESTKAPAVKVQESAAALPATETLPPSTNTETVQSTDLMSGSTQESAPKTADSNLLTVPVPQQNAQPAPVVETPAPVVTPKTESVVKETPKDSPLVAPLNDLVFFYRKEAESIEKMMDLWNGRIQAYDRRAALIREQRNELQDRISKLEDEEGKRGKKEIARLKKQLDRLEKDAKSLRKEVGKIADELADELKDMSNEAPGVIKEKFRQVAEEIRDLSKN